MISIHADSAPNRAAAGPTCYIAPDALRRSRALAADIDASFRADGITTRGIRKRPFRVLVEHSRPSVLVECGFLSNPQESALLHDQTYRRRIAYLIARGLTNHFNR